jgi:hypothetical protein
VEKRFTKVVTNPDTGRKKAPTAKDFRDSAKTAKKK